MYKLWRYMNKKALVCAIIAPIFIMIESAMELNLPRLLSDIIDIGIANQDMDYIIQTGLQMLLYSVIGLFGGVTCMWLSTYAAVSLAGSVREDVFRKIQQMSLTERDQFKTSSLITRLTNDIAQVQQLVMMSMRVFFRAPFLFVGGAVMAFSLSPKLAIIFFVIIPLIVVIVRHILKSSIPKFKVVQRQVDKMNTIMRENLLGIRVVKAFNLEQPQHEVFIETNEDLMNKNIQAQAQMIMLDPIVSFIVNVSIIFVLGFGAILVSNQELEAGKIMAFINYLTQGMMALMTLIRVSFMYTRAKVSVERVEAVLNQPLAAKAKTHHPLPTSHDITFDNVSFTYPNTEVTVLDQVSFTIKQGQHVGIIGPTGSGKSTLVSLIPRIYDVTKGSIYIGNESISNLDIKKLREEIGFVTQESVIFSGSIKSNMMFGSQTASQADLLEAAKQAQAYEFIVQKDHQFESEIDQRGKNLSGGQKQRLSLARAMIRQANILILDDSSSALDMKTEANLRRNLQQRRSDQTLITIAQRISSIKEADMIIVLDQGKVQGIGTHDELMLSNEIYHEIVVSQLGEGAVQ